MKKDKELVEFFLEQMICCITITRINANKSCNY